MARHVVLMGCLLAALGCEKKHPDLVQLPALPVVVAHPVQRDVTDFAVFTARTQAVQSVDVKARVTGYLMDILFKDGDLVTKDKPLFQIDDRPYKATLDQSKAALEEAKASLEEAKATVLLAKAALVRAQAEYDIGLSVQKMNPGAISEQEITRRLGSRDEARANVQKAEASVPKAQASIDQATANLAKAQLNFDWCKVTAPITGRVNRHFVDVGNLVSQDVSTLTNIVSLKPMWAYFDVDENSARRYQKKVDKGEVKGLRSHDIPVSMALAGDRDFPFEGKTDFLSNQLDSNTGSIRLRAVFPNANETIFAGQFARIKVPMSAPHKALLVTDRAVGTEQDKKFVLVVNAANEVERRGVAVGQLHGGLREVRSPELKETDRVIVDGLQRARPGATVKPREVDMLSLIAPPEAEKAK